MSRLKPKAYCLELYKNTLYRLFNEIGLDEFLYDLSKNPILVFTRLQFKTSEIKTRLVFAVPGEIAVLELAILMIFQSCVNQTVQSSYASGLRQVDISKKIKSIHDLLNISFDAKGFDLRVHAFNITMFICLLEETIFVHCPLAKRVLRFINWYLVRGRIYHKYVGVIERCGSLPSGSGFTNLIGTWVTCFNATLFKEMFPDFGMSHFFGSGDDFVTSFLHDSTNLLQSFADFSLLYNNIQYVVDECLVTLPGVRKVEFLGSV